MRSLLYTAVIRPFHMLLTEPVVAAFTLWSAFCFGIVYTCIQSIAQIYEPYYGFTDAQCGSVPTLTESNTPVWLNYSRADFSPKQPPPNSGPHRPSSRGAAMPASKRLLPSFNSSQQQCSHSRTSSPSLHLRLSHWPHRWPLLVRVGFSTRRPLDPPHHWSCFHWLWCSSSRQCCSVVYNRRIQPFCR